MGRRILDLLASMKLTLVCLAAALVLVFAGTLAQVHYGTHVVQERFFQSLLVWWPPESKGIRFPVFPGGHLVGAVLLVNLISAHLRRFRLTLGHAGIHLIHGGLILMLAGGLFTDLFSRESQMQLSPGETKNYSEDPRLRELVLIDKRDKETDKVTAIPEERLRRGGEVSLAGLPFHVEIKHYYANSQIQMLGETAAPSERAADLGVGARVSVKEIPPEASMDGNDLKSAVIQILPNGTGNETASPGTWLVSDGMVTPQGFSCAGGPWEIALRPVRYYKPFSLTLHKFTFDRYAGTEIPKNFASKITLNNPGHAAQRDVLIYMNHPLRYGGETFYQSGFSKDEKSTILQVVRNPGFLTPYIACVVIVLGMLVQFARHFIGFTRRKQAAPTK